MPQEVSGADEEEEEEASESSPQQIMHTTNTLDRSLIFLKCVVIEHVFMVLVSLGKEFSPPLILRFRKIVCAF